MLGSSLLRRAVFAAALGLAGPVAVQAQAPAPAPAAQPAESAVAIARELVDASGAAMTFDNVVPSFVEQAKAVILQTNPDLTGPAREIGEQLKAEFQKRTADLLRLIAISYAQKFTEAELKTLLAFYKSPEGSKLVRTMPSILEDSFVKSQEWGQAVSRDILNRYRAEFEKRGVKL